METYKTFTIYLSTLFCILALSPLIVSAEPASLQKMIDEAEDGDVITIPAGTYTEAITIDKAITLVGDEDVLFQVEGSEPAITIAANEVTLKNLHLYYRNMEKDKAAIFVTSDKNKIENVTIDTDSYGIQLIDAHHNTIQKVTITGEAHVPIPQRNHGIDLFEADHNEITEANISHVEDGIYVESSKENIIHHNHASHLRYGYHLMFTRRTEIFANESYENISGMMIMGTKGTKAYHNILKYNQKNVQSLGLLLYDVSDAIIKENDIAHNRVGIFVEEAHENEITENNVQNNFVGLQFKNAEHNVIYHNAFLANAVQGQAEGSSDNETNRNYWSNHRGLDLSGDGFSDLIYTIDPFYLHITNEYPPYRLLFQSPGMIFLEKMLHTPVEQQLKDVQPLLDNPLEEEDSTEASSKGLFLSSIFLLLISGTIIFMGVTKR